MTEKITGKRLKHISGITIGKILRDLRAEGITISRSTLYREADRHGIPYKRGPSVSGDKGWRFFELEDAAKLKLEFKKSRALVGSDPDKTSLLQKIKKTLS